MSFKKVAAIAGLATALATGITTPASAMNAVNCGDRTDFLRVTENFTVDHCFANAGSVDLGNGYWVNRISSGNNEILWRETDNSYHSMSRWSTINWPTGDTVKVNLVAIKTV
ncbi:beta/gamma crystallin domain-containing protein [Streptomyces sp. Ag109_O5-1]|uniref:beta/gamma crystallin domain-containing protein n=1 Tax=Streptomyces sp. Ag109_O5-1 TaxID=1938851 RepID=UPI000F4F648C|nr:beta/gamma crystallin domain-containing protein [Streptomyces sp. Ag109_O5-1]